MKEISSESSALLRRVQTAMESSVDRLKEWLRLFAADSLTRSEVTTRWWARQSETLHTRLGPRLIRWRAVRVVREMQKESLLTTQPEALELEQAVAGLLKQSLADVERYREQTDCSVSKPDRVPRCEPIGPLLYS